jgi:hypothetical protein
MSDIASSSSRPYFLERQRLASRARERAAEDDPTRDFSPIRRAATGTAPPPATVRRPVRLRPLHNPSRHPNPSPSPSALKIQSIAPRPDPLKLRVGSSRSPSQTVRDRRPRHFVVKLSLDCVVDLTRLHRPVLGEQCHDHRAHFAVSTHAVPACGRARGPGSRPNRRHFDGNLGRRPLYSRVRECPDYFPRK